MDSFSIAMWCLFGLLSGFPQQHAAASAPTQRASPTAAPKNSPPDYSREPFVVERFYTTARFENDGTGDRIQSAKFHVQDDSGVQQLKQLIFAYNSANESIDIHFVRVRKPDGTVISAGADAAKDVAPAAVRDAPAYSNYREKHITAPGLRPGDTLEYEVAVHISAPLARNEFWYQQNFIEDAVVLDERLEVDVPQGRALLIESPDLKYEKTEVNQRTIYRWKHATLVHGPEDDGEKTKAQERAGRPTSVQLTTFASWDAVARWYANLEKRRAKPDAEIRAKSQQLIAGRSGQRDKIRALYDYVAKNIRYVNLSFGLAGYQPRSAAAVFKNRYGDSQGKQTLLAAMLASAGISSDAVLIPPSRALDKSLPSPAQFDHLITAIPENGGFIWMDSSTGVAPFRFLASPLRGQSALLVAPDGACKIVKTPEDPPFLSTQRVEIEGGVSDLGKLTASVRYFLRGDNEFALRVAFQQTPQAEWKQLAQTLLSLDGIPGQVTSVTPADPSATNNPFELDLQYSQLNFLDWSSKKSAVALPLLTIGLPQTGSGPSAPIHLGSPLDVSVSLKLTMPPNLEVQAPVGTSISRDFADFKSSYQFANRTLIAARTLNFKLRELPASRTSDYVAFTRAVESDESQPLIAENPAPGVPPIPASAKPADLFESGVAALSANNLRSAIPLLRRAVALDPKHEQAWNDLGLAYLHTGKLKDAAMAFRRQIEVNPHDAHVHNYLGIALQGQQKYDEAASAFRAQIAINPLDTVAHAALGGMLLDQDKYSDAVPELDKATILSPDDAALQVSLAKACFGADQKNKALAAFEKAAEMSRSPKVWNIVARSLADRSFALDKAAQYAQAAVTATDRKLRDVDLSHVTRDDFAETANLGVYWDTLGWIYFQKGDLDRAERYAHSAWALDESSEAADHLGQIYEKRGKKDDAIRKYSLAIAASPQDLKARTRLAALLGVRAGDSKIEASVASARGGLRTLRTIDAGKLSSEKADADFVLLFSSSAAGAKVEAVRFLGGDAQLRRFADRLRLLHYDSVFPDASPAKIVRRAALTCSAKTSRCAIVLALPQDVHAAN